jgi:hypothetical protein
MSAASSVALAASISDSSEPECAPLGSVNRTGSASESSRRTGPECPVTPTSVDSGESTSLQLTFFAEVPPVKTSALSASGSESRAPARVFGSSISDSLANYDPDTCSWRTSHNSESSSESSQVDWPKSGTTRSGTLSRLKTSVPRISDVACGLLPTPRASSYGNNQGGAAGRTGKVRPSLQSMALHGLWPTPRASDGAKNIRTLAGARKEMARGHGVDLASAVQLWPTPTASRRSGLQSHGANAILGPLNPTWVEWLMGFPTGWTEIEPSVTPSSQPSPNGSDTES